LDSYEQQTISGFEGGVKALLLNRSLRVNLDAYRYNLKGVQVSSFQIVAGQAQTSAVTNAAGARTWGFSGDFEYATPLQGLNVHGSAAYNRAFYTRFDASPCYNGQTPALGCSLDPILGVPVQDLSGDPLTKAPRWSLAGGIGYEGPLSKGLKFGLSTDVTYNSKFYTIATNDPNSVMPKYALLDATLRLMSESGSWELQLIGKNLTDKYVWFNGGTVPLTGSGGGQPTSQLGDYYAIVGRGREFWLRASHRF
jgi:iron complex outermembrane receptor protein